MLEVPPPPPTTNQMVSIPTHQGRTGGVFDNKIGVLDMGEPMRWSDPGLEMRGDDMMPQAREHSAICYDPEARQGRLVGLVAEDLLRTWGKNECFPAMNRKIHHLCVRYGLGTL